MATKQSGRRGRNPGRSAVQGPDFLRPGVRCAIEMVLAGSLILLVGLPAENVVYFGVVVTLAMVVMVVILFWALNRQMEQWIRAAQQTR